MPGYPRHLPSFDYCGCYRYSLTFCTFQRRQYFRDECHIALVCDHFFRTAARERFALIAYCFMPDHLHLLAVGTDAAAALKPFIKSAKQRSGYYFTRRTGVALWQRYGYEHVLRSDESTFRVARYILENPLRARLVADVEAYPFWGSSVYSREELLEYVRAA